ncbi:MAG TPA: hypothetical protein VMP01_01320 [Pirellulaceae bacterium]|nr:hypothetical protein [Pirellulaceae bacterium]
MKPLLPMTRHFTFKLTIATLVLLPALWSLAPAQDPFAEAAKAPEPAAADGKKGKAKLVPLEIPKAKPLLLEYLDEHKPTTPEQLLKAAQVTLNIGEPAECKKYLAGFIAAKPDDAATADLGRKLGPEFFLRLQREPDVQPEGAQAAMLVLDAMNNQARDPANLARLIGELGNSDPAQRALARNSLAEGRVEAVLALIAALANRDQASLHRQVQFTLLEMKRDSEGPLLGALESGDEALLAKVIETLGAMESHAAAPKLVRLSIAPNTPPAIRAAATAALVRTRGTSPKPEEARRYLEKLYERQLSQAQVLQPALDEPVRIWQWDASESAPVARVLPPGDAALVQAREIAGELARLAPMDEYYRKLNLMTALEADKVLTGFDRPLPQGDGTAAAFAAHEGPEAIAAALAEALKRDRVGAAIGAAELLGKNADSRVLLDAGGGEMPLAKCLRHSDRRLRITAALAIARIAPEQSFAGASRVAESLAHFAGTGGARRVLIGHPRGQAGQNLVGYMNEMGYEAEVAPTGRAVQQQIIENADYEFLLLSDTLDAPAMKEVVQWLRRDYRTARLPVGVMTRGENVDVLREDLEDDRLTYVFPAIADGEVARELVLRLERIAGRNLISRDERLDMASDSLDALARLASQPQPAPNYDLLRHEDLVIRALTVSALSSRAAAVVARLGTSNGQTALVELASQDAYPLADRQAAAAALATAVKHRGLLLTKEQIREQYDRYNASETKDAQTQAVLGSILDAIEARAVASAPAPEGK